jgi:acetamidase/formamidase
MSAGRHHHLRSTPQTVHWGFLDAGLPPVLTIASGDSVTIDCVSGLPDWMPEPDRGFTILPDLVDIFANVKKGSGNHILTGPIYIEGADVGDVLEVNITDIALRQNWGWNVFRGYMGTLPEDFPFFQLLLLELDLVHNQALLPSGFRVPMAPFFGQLAVAPRREFGRQNSKEPREFGGNLDCKALTAGSTIYLPVWNQGALFSTGDGHAAQGDGEVDGTAIETSLSGTFTFTVRKDLCWTMPHAETADKLIAFGLDADLDDAAKQALRAMIAWIVAMTGISEAEAYALCSFACDLHVTQTVNIIKGVHAILDKSVLIRG